MGAWGRGLVGRGQYGKEGGGHTKVLDGDVAGSLHAGVLGQDAQTVLDDFLGGRVHDGDAVVIAHASVAGNDPLCLLDGRASADFNVGGELADWLFARCVYEVSSHAPQQNCSSQNTMRA